MLGWFFFFGTAVMELMFGVVRVGVDVWSSHFGESGTDRGRRLRDLSASHSCCVLNFFLNGNCRGTFLGFQFFHGAR